jgi:hypothetical protein
MITMQEFMKTVNYRITEGSDYGWRCYGSNSHSLSAWNGVHDDGGWSANIVFDTVDQTVYEVEICDYTNQRAYRVINPDFRDEYNKECKDRGEFADCAWDNVKFTDLEVDSDWLEKTQAIVAGKEYDTRVSIPIELPDHELLVLFKMAHDRDMKFNDFVEEVLKEALADFERNPEKLKERVQFTRPSVPHGY